MADDIPKQRDMVRWVRSVGTARQDGQLRNTAVECLAVGLRVDAQSSTGNDAPSKRAGDLDDFRDRAGEATLRCSGADDSQAR